MTQRENGNITEAELIRQLGELPRRVEPRNDPWPRIANRMAAEETTRTGSGAPWFRIAAAVALAFSLGIFLGNSLQLTAPTDSSGDAVADSNEVFMPSPGLGAALAGTEREYQAAFSEFTMIGQGASELKPATLDAIERDWQVMLDAEAALASALEQYPDNPWLNKRMLELRERQLAMLKQLAGLDRTSRRNEI
jgi:hypothetical protein